jgi:hypothetical protein
MDFLRAKSLPGPNSLTLCVLQKLGMYGNTEVCSYEKSTNLSQVPGFTYQIEPLLDLPRPIEWTPQVICKHVLQSIHIERSSRFKIIYGSDDLLIKAAN